MSDPTRPARADFPLMTEMVNTLQMDEARMVCTEADLALDELDWSREAIRALVERTQRGGPSNILDFLDRYMSTEAALIVRRAAADYGTETPNA